MSAKSKILDLINKKAQRIREKREEAKSHKGIEPAVFEFFKQVDDARALHNGEHYNIKLFEGALNSLREKVHAFSRGSKVDVEWQNGPDVNIDYNWPEDIVRGVTIYWHPNYVKANDVAETLYIDVADQFFTGVAKSD